MSKAKVNDIQVYYDVKGEGFPLVMIMGLGANVDWWCIDSARAKSQTDRHVYAGLSTFST